MFIRHHFGETASSFTLLGSPLACPGLVAIMAYDDWWFGTDGGFRDGSAPTFSSHTSAPSQHWFGDDSHRGRGADPQRQQAFEHMDAATAMMSTSKVPLYWEPSLERRGFPLRVWMQDIGIWVSGTELHQQQIGGAVTQRLGGVARDMTREIPLTILRDGRMELAADGLTQTQVTGIDFLLRGLQRRFG